MHVGVHGPTSAQQPALQFDSVIGILAKVLRPSEYVFVIAQFDSGTEGPSQYELFRVNVEWPGVHLSHLSVAASRPEPSRDQTSRTFAHAPLLDFPRIPNLPHTYWGEPTR